MDIVSFKQAFDPLLARHLASQYEVYKKITSNPDVLEILSHIQKVSTGGKRLRPFIVWSVYTQTHKTASLKDIESLLVAVELFHVFCLIHDDIMDEASLRHGVPTLHAYTKTLLKNTRATSTVIRASESQAILAGDILFNHVHTLLNTSNWTNAIIREKVRSVFNTLVDEVCIGQMLDIDLTTHTNTTEDTLLEKNRLKTAYYSFARPFHIGTVVGEREDLTDLSLLFGEKIGMLFQIQDDLLDIIGNPLETKKEVFTDLSENQHTVLTEYIRKKAEPKFRDHLNTLCGKPKETLNTEEVLSLFTDSGSIAYAHSLINVYTKEATDLIEHADITAEDKRLFQSILLLLTNRTT